MKPTLISLFFCFGMHSFALAQNVGTPAGEMLRDSVDSNPKCNMCDVDRSEVVRKEPVEKPTFERTERPSKSDTGGGGGVNPPRVK
jgi:hypothetical protein